MELTLEQKRAVAMAKARARAAQAQGSDTLGEAQSFLNKGIAETIGAPVDLVSAGLRGIGVDVGPAPFLGSEFFRNTFQGIGAPTAEADVQAEGYLQNISQGVGNAAGMLPAVVGVAGRAAQSASPVISGVGEMIKRPFVQAPIRSTGTELAAGAGAAAGIQRAEQLAAQEGENATELQKALYGLGGGVAAGVAPGAAMRTAGAAIRNAPVSGTLIKALNKAIFPFTEEGGRVRASERMRGLSADPERDAARALDAGEGNLSPAQRTGNERLMALEQTVRDENPQIDEALARRSDESNRALREGLVAPAGGAGAREVQSFLAQERAATIARVQEQVAKAQAKAAERLAKVTPERRETANAEILRTEIDKALAKELATERRLWQAVPREVEIDTTPVRDRFAEIMAATPRAQRDDIPSIAKTLLGEDGFKDFETVNELHGLYSKLRTIARQERARSNRNAARIADELADGALASLESATGSTPEVTQTLAAARQHTRILSEVYDQGAVGGLLGRKRDGGDMVPVAQTFERTIARGGAGGAGATDEILMAIQDGQEGRSAVADYLRGRFQEYTTTPKGFSADRADTFMRRNAEILDQLPEVRDALRQATEATRGGQRTTRTGERALAALNDPRQSAGAAFVGAPYGQEVQAILRAKNPAMAAESVARQAGRDKTGEAVRGLKGAFLDDLISKATTDMVSETGDRVISGRALSKALQDTRTRAALNKVFSKAEMDRMGRIAAELTKAETAARRLPDVGGTIDDLPNTIVSLIGRTFAARQGAKAGAGTSGASLLTANFASKRMQSILSRLTNDKAAQLIRDAMQDPELFAALLAPQSRTAKASRTTSFVERTIVPWAIGQGIVSAQEMRQ